ncbi:proline dehydrogenase family protein [Nocardioides humi]|uniref:Proline dehydrogenase family protein n=1 Tax=Nocardioides humi TaxID=449461 RepID=A0ABN1ZU30_9ACTN|nr:proline dehydrogenase family protein [Nocardioides humi]
MRPVRDSLTLLSRSAPARRVVRRFVAGERVDDLVRVVAELAADGFPVSVAHLGAPAHPEVQAVAAVAEYRTLLDRLSDAGLAAGADVTIRSDLPGESALSVARKVCRTAARVGATVTIAPPEAGEVDRTLALVAALRQDFPDVGVALSAALPRTEDDCRALAVPGSRVRIERGGPDADSAEVDKAYVRCLKVLLAGEGYPVIATHDPRLIEIAGALASRYGRAPSTYELQLPYGIRSAEQRRLVASGERVRVYLPYGAAWHGYLMRRVFSRQRGESHFDGSLLPRLVTKTRSARVAERPANLRLFLTSLVSRR